MNVTIQDAINAFALLSEHVNENGFLYECYNLGIEALKTIQDGNYQLKTTNVSHETLEKIANHKCNGVNCNDCEYWQIDKELGNDCVSTSAMVCLTELKYRKRVEKWMKEHSNY